MTDGMTPSQFQILREDIQAVSRRLDHLVTRDAFRDEQHRVDERFEGQGREIGELKGKLESESQARVTSELAQAHSARATAEKATATQKQTNWQWFVVLAGPVVAFLVGWVANGGLAR